MNSFKVTNTAIKRLTQKKFNGRIDNIKSRYILKIIFNNLCQKKLLNVIGYNKKLQKRLNINKEDYKKYSETYTTIEIIVIPIKKKSGKFYNIPYKEKNSYFKVYFNNNNKEKIRRNYITKTDKVKTIKIIINYQVSSLSGLFSSCKILKYIFFKKFFRNNIKDMSYMFSDCSSLKAINLSNFRTDNVSNMSNMFLGCSSLIELNLSNFKTDKVINMSFMFCGCESLEKLNITNFKINDKSNLFGMFCESSLKEEDFPNLNNNNNFYSDSISFECINEFKKRIINIIKNIILMMALLFICFFICIIVYIFLK